MMYFQFSFNSTSARQPRHPVFIRDSRYQGFQSTHVAQSPTLTANGRAKMAQVAFDSPDLASVAKEALDGFTLKKGWVMTVQYV